MEMFSYIIFQGGFMFNKQNAFYYQVEHTQMIKEYTSLHK